ncbi:hypothetical protein ABK040_000579 [Willaertia magna]
MFNLIFNVYNANSGEPSGTTTFIHQQHQHNSNNNNQYQQQQFEIPNLFQFFIPAAFTIIPNVATVNSQQNNNHYNNNPFFFNINDILNQSYQQYMQQQINKTTPTSNKIINELPSFQLTKERKEIMNQCGEHCDHSCSVCICDFEESENLIRLPCGHLFHKDCIMPWIKDHNSCPTCRFELPTDDTIKEKERIKRMNERFTEQGMKLFDLSTKVDNVLSKVDSLIQKSQNEKITNNEINKLDGELMNLTLELDALEFSENGWIRNQRKAQIVKIQAMLQKLDQLRLNL